MHGSLLVADDHLTLTLKLPVTLASANSSPPRVRNSVVVAATSTSLLDQFRAYAVTALHVMVVEDN